MNNKFKIQDSEYLRPYHHLVSFDKEYKQWESTNFGLEYSSYVLRLIKTVKNLQFKNLAEVGCGDGKITLELAKRYPNRNFEGYDLSKRAILFAKGYAYGYNNLKFFDYDFAKSLKKYDLILCIEVLEHISDSEIKIFLDTIYKKLNKDGRIIFTVPSTNMPLIKKHYRHYTLDLLKKQLKDFKLINVEYLYKKGLLIKILNKMIENRFFITKNKYIIKIIYKLFIKYGIIANKNNGTHILVICKKNE